MPTAIITIPTAALTAALNFLIMLPLLILSGSAFLMTLAGGPLLSGVDGGVDIVLSLGRQSNTLQTDCQGYFVAQ